VTSTAKDQPYQDLKRRILTMELEAGASLDETRISTEYGVFRTPNFQAIKESSGAINRVHLLARDYPRRLC
jgi:DNA-binding GntR family transcriptional regulator